MPARWTSTRIEIAAIGESAGANLAALLGVYSQAPNGTVSPAAVDAVVALSTPTDLARLYAQSPAGRPCRQAVSGRHARSGARELRRGLADRSCFSRLIPPMFLVHGRQDPLIPVSQSKDMAAALAAAGVPDRLILVNGGHDLDFPGHYSNLIPQMLEFLDTNLEGLEESYLDLLAHAIMRGLDGRP